MKKENVSITLDSGTLQLINEQAKKEARNFSNMVQWMALKYFERLKEDCQ